MDLTLEPIVGEDVDAVAANVKVAHDDEFIYVLFSVDDDYNWDAADAHMSGAAAVMWAVESGAGPHRGVGAEDGGGPSLGRVDIGHWELGGAWGGDQGGSVSAAGVGQVRGNGAGWDGRRGGEGGTGRVSSQNVLGRGFFEAGYHAKKGGFTASRGTKQYKELPLIAYNINSLYGLHIAKVFYKTSRFYDSQQILPYELRASLQ